MLDALKTLPDIQPVESMLVKAADLAATQQRQRLLAQARRRAKECVTDAESESAEIRAAAFREGYLQGLMQAGTDIGQALLSEQGLAVRVRQQAIEMLRGMLG